jgi:U4/U6 small nuclear ribonucleoprotein PRP3
VQANARNIPTPTPVAPRPVEAEANPYSAGTSKDIEGPLPKDRAGRAFRFNQKGKYIALASQINKEVRAIYFYKW